VQVEPLIHGAGHERGRRASTENVASIVGLGAACQVVGATLLETAAQLQTLRDRLHQGLMRNGIELSLNGHPVERLPNTLNVSFVGIDSSTLLTKSPEVAASTGSACHAGQTEPSSVLLAMGTPRAVALGAVRFSLGRWTTEEDVEQAVTFLLQRLSSL